MNKEFKQNEKNKKEFTIKNKEFIEFIQSNSVNGLIEIERIEEFLNSGNRNARRRISDMSMFYPIISLSQEKGYEVLTVPSQLGSEEILVNIERVDHQINDYNSRIAVLKRKMKPLIAWKKVAEKILKERKVKK